ACKAPLETHCSNNRGASKMRKRKKQRQAKKGKSHRAKKMTPEKAKTKRKKQSKGGGALPDLPKGYVRAKSISSAEAARFFPVSVNEGRFTMAAEVSRPPYVCVRTGPPPNPCLRYRLDPATGQYSIPPYGEVIDCALCASGL